MKTAAARWMTGLLCMGLCLIPVSHAHTPLVSCYDNADGTVTCEGGFSDGSSASGVALRVETVRGRILLVAVTRIYGLIAALLADPDL